AVRLPIARHHLGLLDGVVNGSSHVRIGLAEPHPGLGQSACGPPVLMPAISRMAVPRSRLNDRRRRSISSQWYSSALLVNPPHLEWPYNKYQVCLDKGNSSLAYRD